jgi:D-hydroxyproline dehydrogenase subunit beta
MTQYDDAVIGAGILGLAHAYQLARRGRRVIVFERHPRARGASARNFGMIWPIGQPLGAMRDLALRSRDIWLELLLGTGLWHDRCGSLHLAYRDDEARVLREFAQQSHRHGESFRLLDPSETVTHARAVKREGLQLALFSRDEVCVDPREVVDQLPGWLRERYGVEFQFSCTITSVALPKVCSGRREWSAKRSWICSGDELGVLYPDQLETSGLVRCKLQMMRSQAYPSDWRIGPLLAAGLTLRHYASFQDCPSLAALKRRIAEESPWFEHYGIHVLVSQNGRGELTIGDSHEYGAALEPFDKDEIDEWVRGYLKTFLDARDLRITSRWSGIYVKHPSEPFMIMNLDPGVVAITGVGGAGLTLSFGLAERVVSQELGESAPAGTA